MIGFLYGAGMQVGLRHFDSRTLDWLAVALRSGEHTRHALARELCERTGWLNALGRPCLSAAAAALPALAERIGTELPPARDVPDPAAAPAVPAGDVPDTRLACALEDLGPVSLDLVGDADDRRLWVAMMEAHHPLGWARPPGGQVRYWIRSERHGVLGGIGFGSAAWQLRARDGWIGWSADARAANIARVICNHRYLLLPGVRVYGLASEILRMAARRVADDWEARYSVRPVAAYTHVGPEHDGYCYHCAGWTVAGRTGGRRNEAGTVRTLALEDGWRKALCHVSRRPVGALAGAYDGTDLDWAEREYGRTGHTDGRVRRRIVDMGRSWLKNMGEDLPVIFPTKAEQKAAYRLLSNPGISMEHVLEPHFEATADRCRAEPVVLALQDTTALNYSGLEATTGLDGIGGGGKGSVGILAHAGLAVTAEGRPLGLFAMDAAFREDPEEDSRRWVEGLGRARELAAACPDTRVVSVCDREGDFWDLLAHAVDDGDALLVRASRSAQQRVTVPGGGKACLWEHVAARPPVATTELTIPAAGGPRARKERVARLEIRTAEVWIVPPRWDRGADPLPMFAVSATETGADGDDPLQWLLLTTERPAEGEADAVHAATVLGWYRLRWTIETWFRTLKTGTRIKDRRLDSADDLRKCLAFDAVTAVHVADITVLARERPETPATEAFPEEDVDLLHTMLESQGHRDVVRMPAGQVPDIRAVVIDLGRLVGSHPNPRQPLPGTKKVWQGLERLNWAIQVRDAIGERKRE